MPNWVYNSLTIEGDKKQIKAIKEQLNKPFKQSHDSWDSDTKQMRLVETLYSNPVFAFYNIYNHTQEGISDEEYLKQPDHKQPLEEALMFKGNHWYDWNVRNWGTKWDVAIHDEEKYPDTQLQDEGKDFLSYSFNTAWSPPLEAISKLSAQYPDLDFELSFEEETGWGGLIQFEEGNQNEIESYENKCRDCDSNNTMEYCENDCGEICSDCNYMGEADLDIVAECDTHKVYLDDDHVPDYRKVEA